MDILARTVSAIDWIIRWVEPGRVMASSQEE